MGFSNDKRDQLVGVVGALFALPFILFSMAGGYFADRFSKRSVTIGIKVFEILCHAAGAGRAGGQPALPGHRLRFPDGGSQRDFRPSKYGLLPELLPERKLSWGNGVLELGTFVSIIGGTVVGGVAVQNICRKAGVVRRGADRAGGIWASHQLGHQQGARPPIRRKNSAPIFWRTCGGKSN